MITASIVTPISNMLQYSFMQHAFIAGAMVAALAAAVGYFVMLRRLAFAGHALAHIGFAGATGGLLIGLSPIAGQLLLSIVAAGSMGFLGNRINKSDLAIGIILAFALGLGMLFLHLYNGFAGQATSILFGDLLGVSAKNLCYMLLLIVISFSGLSLIARPLLFASLEPELAEAKGVSITVVGVLFFIIMAVAVTLASQVVGILLVFTLLIGPPAIALQWVRQFWSGIILSMLLSVLLTWLGILLAYLTDWPISFWISTLVLISYCIGLVLPRFK